MAWPLHWQLARRLGAAVVIFARWVPMRAVDDEGGEQLARPPTDCRRAARSLGVIRRARLEQGAA